MTEIKVGDIVKVRADLINLYIVENVDVYSYYRDVIANDIISGISVHLDREEVFLATDTDIIKALQLEVLRQDYEEAYKQITEG